MEISLAQITQKNYEAICELEVTEEQEEYVATNTWSLVEAAYNPGYFTRAIIADEEPVGFFMWVQESKGNPEKASLIWQNTVMPTAELFR